MAKGNKKTRTAGVETKIRKAFVDFEEILDDLIEQANKGEMPLLAQSFTLSKAILTTYKRAWIWKIKEDIKN